MSRYEYIGDGFLIITPYLMGEGMEVQMVLGKRVTKVANVLVGRASLEKTIEDMH